jgi:hypothetical protein
MLMLLFRDIDDDRDELRDISSDSGSMLSRSACSRARSADVPAKSVWSARALACRGGGAEDGAAG